MPVVWHKDTVPGDRPGETPCLFLSQIKHALVLLNPTSEYKVEPLDLDAEAVLKLMFINSSSFTFTKTKSTVAQNRETEIFHINQVVHHFNNKKTH